MIMGPRLRGGDIEGMAGRACHGQWVSAENQFRIDC
jgi:hypothetical protein